MTEEIKSNFRNRIGNANRTQMIVVVYDIALEYINSAVSEYGEGNVPQFLSNVTAALKCVESLMDCLDFEYEISKQLLELYVYVNKCLLKGKLKMNMDFLKEAEYIIVQMRDAFMQVSLSDTTGPLMDSTRHVEVGMTYGKGSLNENIVDPEGNHSFSV